MKLEKGMVIEVEIYNEKKKSSKKYVGKIISLTNILGAYFGCIETETKVKRDFASGNVRKIIKGGKK